MVSKADDPNTLTVNQALATAVEHRVLTGPGELDPAIRQEIAARAAGGPAGGNPYDDLARQVGEAAYRVTDAQVAQAVAAAGSERAAFEVIAAASLGAGLLRWRHGMRALEEARNATA